MIICRSLVRPRSSCCSPRAAVRPRLLSTSPCQSAIDEYSESLRWEEEYASGVHVSWFPGHMRKATRIIKEKLTQVDMVFEVRDARMPFSSANPDLDRIVGSSKSRLIVLNKSDLANPGMKIRTLERFRMEGKHAIFVCSKAGTSVRRLQGWARDVGARRGEFKTTGAIGMVVGMPNVGKSSIINMLRSKSEERIRKDTGDTAKQVARIGAMPGVTRQISAFRICESPTLYLLDTPGVMVPRVKTPVDGLRLALIHAIPDAAIPDDFLVGYMLEQVRRRRKPNQPLPGEFRRRGEQNFVTHRPERRLSVIDQWLLNGGRLRNEAQSLSSVSGDRARDMSELDMEALWREDDTEDLLNAVTRESGAEGKSQDEARRMCCAYLLERFRSGAFGTITIDHVPAVTTQTVSDLTSGYGIEHHTRHRARQPSLKRSQETHKMADVLNRDWSNPSAWEVP